MTLLFILLATFINGLVAFTGATFLFFGPKKYGKILFLLVAFSTGALLGGAFFHLIPESLEAIDSNLTFILVLIGFSAFFLMEKYFHWRHCHDDECNIHPASYLLLFGDGIHNFIDGLVIAASFMVDFRFGVITTILIIAHELPQELGDFGVLVHLGMKVKKALIYNFLSQLTAVAGGIVGYILSGNTEFSTAMLPIAAGGFIYIAASDLIPELHKERQLKRSIANYSIFLVGICFIVILKILLGE
ncbi:TPA: ZIP family metal transporter [Candidatus Berkelbacteria bacterium]|uniref:Zinc/iron permease n=1 Tax=Berkelbacteria bacterium GW2011_GWE1_39_12 TaxID=1618337 RepID=A0A0G4B3J7_9BACT|nr:MAG: zinc/iron permease [Berkelbacteria bacterium GW2011_GWE1_39_12]HBO61010.1 ZIP family metal transporter [Candidatus Berkelbacteria bacterium]